jgi:hypothetical protein
VALRSLRTARMAGSVGQLLLSQGSRSSGLRIDPRCRGCYSLEVGAARTRHGDVCRCAEGAPQAGRWALLSAGRISQSRRDEGWTARIPNAAARNAGTADTARRDSRSTGDHMKTKDKPSVKKACSQCGWEDYTGHSQFYEGVCCRCAGCTCWGPGPNPNCPVHVNGW